MGAKHCPASVQQLLCQDWLLQLEAKRTRAVFQGRQSAETAFEQVAERYNMEIETTKAANPAMRKQWRADWGNPAKKSTPAKR